MSEVDEWLAELIKMNDDAEKMTHKQIKIVQAAVEVFSSKGFAGSSTSEIAQKAGVAEGTIFRHYKTKKELLLSIVAPIMTRLITPFALKDFVKVLEADYPEVEDFLRAVIHNRMNFAQKNLSVIKILLHEIPFHPELQQQFKEIVAKQVLLRATKIVKHFQVQGKMIELPTETAIRFIASSAIGLILIRLLFLPEADWNDEQEIEYTIDFIMHGLAPRG
ncbi:TetR/AcrR family transcriptional regulator [Paenibacillus eucommiae]|uniref:AcrR family transcriptional regulator n=1 Tax=Paenibacillus eucommiae TaxID=1355755 RepID=A0ABS4J0D2_9BACL|nr:TetR/AcrR family transcriptional regulator [Paenibacillus eucommiae]MBP1992701.1 AcrR family transcriptional regulator [Paenibacillus eucommiae]